MKEFRVKIYAQGTVETVVVVKAEDKQSAEKEAMKFVPWNCNWEFSGADYGFEINSISVNKI